MVNINENCQFLKDLETPNNFGGTTKALYNLAGCTGQVRLFSQGIKPTRYWRLKDVKNYFGLVGGTDKILSQLEQLQAIINDINLTNERR